MFPVPESPRHPPSHSNRATLDSSQHATSPSTTRSSPISLGRDSRRGTRIKNHEPHARHVDDDPPGRAEAAILRVELGWADVDIGGLLGIHYSNVSRRWVNNLNPDQVERMCEARRRSRMLGGRAEGLGRRSASSCDVGREVWIRAGLVTRSGAPNEED